MIQDMAEALDVIMPIVGVAVGALLTYLVNVRVRREGRAEQAIHDAIRQVSLVAAMDDLVVHDHGWAGATPEQIAAFNADLGAHSTLAWLKAVVDARAAVYSAAQFEPTIGDHVRASPRAFTRDAQETLVALRDALEHRRSASQRVLTVGARAAAARAALWIDILVVPFAWLVVALPALIFGASGTELPLIALGGGLSVRAMLQGMRSRKTPAPAEAADLRAEDQQRFVLGLTTLGFGLTLPFVGAYPWMAWTLAPVLVMTGLFLCWSFFAARWSEQRRRRIADPPPAVIGPGHQPAQRDEAPPQDA